MWMVDTYSSRSLQVIIHVIHTNVNQEALQLHTVNPYCLLQVMQEFVSGTPSHVRMSEHAMK